jgi:hypothetical protein
MSDLSRRAFLGGALAAASVAVAAAALPPIPEPPKPEPKRETIIIDGADGAIRAGDVFTIAGVYAVDRVTKRPTRKLQQFTVIGSTSRNKFMLEKSQ